MFRSSASGSTVAEALELMSKRFALPERAHAADATCVVEVEYVNAVERHGAVGSHAIPGPAFMPGRSNRSLAGL